MSQLRSACDTHPPLRLPPRCCLAEDGDLFLRFAAREDSAAGAVAVAETVVAVLLSTGLEVRLLEGPAAVRSVQRCMQSGVGCVTM